MDVDQNGNVGVVNVGPEKAPPPKPAEEESLDAPSADSNWVPNAPLSENGPWYVVSNREGLYAFNMDGTGLSFLAPETGGSYELRQSGVASRGGRFAYLTTVDGYDQAKLQIIDIAHPANNKTISLFSSDDADIDARRAVVEQPSFAWSHDGEKLAFFGVMDGPSSDLYLYTPAVDEIIQLTTGPSQGYQPSWSPDDLYIVHTGADSFGTGAGYSMAGVWAAAADDSGVLTLPMPGGSADEVILGWRDNDTFLSYTWGPGSGPHNLRFTNLHAANAQEVWEWPFNQAAISSGGDGRILVGIDGYAADENPVYGDGLYVLAPRDYQPDQLFDTSPGYIKPLESGAFLVYIGGSNYLIESSDFTEIPNWDSDFIFSTDGALAGYSFKGLWVNLGGENQVVFVGPVQHAAWGAGGTSILFSSDETLWVVTAPEWEPIGVAAAFFTDNIVLVMP